MNQNEIVQWLLQGDVSIRYQVYRDLLGEDRKELQQRISTEGWGRIILSKRKAGGHWGKSFYQPKWISSHYTLLDLRNLNLSPDNAMVKDTIDRVLVSGKSADGGIALGPSTSLRSDVCVNGMFLNYASYFRSNESDLQSVVDCILSERMPDGGFNCRSVTVGAKHSSLHTTISVLEGLTEFLKSGNTYRIKSIRKAIRDAGEFILLHHLFISDRTGSIISRNFLKLAYPYRWKYDILRAMDYFQYSAHARDARMEEAISIIQSKKNRDGVWNATSSYPGRVHLTMEKAGRCSRWNTLRALRVLKYFAG